MNGEKADAHKDRMGRSGTRVHFRALERRILDNLSYGSYTEYRKRALPADGWPLSHVIEVIAELLGRGRRSLLFCDLENQTNDADNHKTELKQV